MVERVPHFRLSATVLAALMMLALAPVSFACGSPQRQTSSAPRAEPAASHQSPARSTKPAPRPPPTLPRGGRTIFPRYRVVAYYGASGSSGLGVLGAGTPEQAAAAVERQSQLFAFAGRPVLPALELISTLALASPGPDGTYSSHGDPDDAERYLQAARRHKELLVLDFQPGQGDFLPQIKRFERILAQPDVGVAVDPEWHMKPGEVPGTVYGSSSAASINEVSAYLARIVARDRLPQKLLVIHQFRQSVLPDRQAIIARPGIATVFHADGNGTPYVKVKVYDQLAFPDFPFSRGFKLFFTQDTPLMTPQQAMALRPAPDLVTYQ